MQEVSNDLHIELARREICWLIKDRLIKNGVQAGFSFVRTQVQPATPKKLIDILQNRFSKEPSPVKLRELLCDHRLAWWDLTFGGTEKTKGFKYANT